MMTSPIEAKVEEIRYQLKCNVEVIERSHPDPEPRILPHVIVTLTGHVEDRLKELEALIEQERTDAERWRALMSSQRMHFMGSAGFKHIPKDGDVENRLLVNQTPVPRAGQPMHFGLEFWDVDKPDDRFPDTFERELLTVYVDAIRERSK